MRKPISQAQLKRLQTLLTKANLREEKEEIISHYTNGRSTSSRQLTSQEATDCCDWLQGIADQYQEEDPCNQMRKKMLYYGYMMGYDEPTNDRQSGLPAKQINYINVDDWCKKWGIHKQPLNKLTRQQLHQTVSQFLQVYKSTMKAVGK
ncbi:MAG: hypothetical protein RJQ09_21350 [Cyclobacteriaceae bacterium]